MGSMIMNEVTRYVIKLKNGSFMKQEYKESLELVEIHSVDHPIDADLFKRKSTASRTNQELLSKNTNFPVVYDEDEAPTEVVKVSISIDIK